MNLINSAQNQKKIKCALLGDTGVGKSSFMTRLLYGKFDEKYKGTTGIDISSLLINHNTEKVRLQIFDHSGRSKFKNLLVPGVAGADICLIFYDITNKLSLHNISKWVKEVWDINGKNALIVLIGTKTDLEHQRSVSVADSQKLAESYNTNAFEISLKTEEGLSNTINTILTLLVNKSDDDIFIPYLIGQRDNNQDMNQSIQSCRIKPTNEQYQTILNLLKAKETPSYTNQSGIMNFCPDERYKQYVNKKDDKISMNDVDKSQNITNPNNCSFLSSREYDHFFDMKSSKIDGLIDQNHSLSLQIINDKSQIECLEQNQKEFEKVSDACHITDENCPNFSIINDIMDDIKQISIPEEHLCEYQIMQEKQKIKELEKHERNEQKSTDCLNQNRDPLVEIKAIDNQAQEKQNIEKEKFRIESIGILNQSEKHELENAFEASLLLDKELVTNELKNGIVPIKETQNQLYDKPEIFSESNKSRSTNISIDVGHRNQLATEEDQYTDKSKNHLDMIENLKDNQSLLTESSDTILDNQELNTKNINTHQNLLKVDLVKAMDLNLDIHINLSQQANTSTDYTNECKSIAKPCFEENLQHDFEVLNAQLLHNTFIDNNGFSKGKKDDELYERLKDILIDQNKYPSLLRWQKHMNRINS